MSLPSSGSIKFSDLRNTLGPGNVSVPIKFSDYKQNPTTDPYYTKGIPGITDTNLSISQFYSKKNALKSGFTYKVFRGTTYTFTAGSAGRGGAYSSYRGGGGAGGVLVSQNGSNIAVTTSAQNGGFANGGEGGIAGVGFGAGGGGGGLWYGVSVLQGGSGANGFCYIYYKTSGTEYFTQSNVTYTFTSTDTVKIIMMGGGGSGGYGNSSTGTGGGGGGGGNLQVFSIKVTSSTSATITIGSGGDGASTTSGGNTTLVYSGTTYTAVGGVNGGTTINGGYGSSSGGQGGLDTATSGYSAGNYGPGTFSQNTASFTFHTTYVSSGSGGYFADVPTWFSTRNNNYIGTTTDMTNINTSTGGVVPNDNSWLYFSVEWFGYFCPTVSGNHTFYLNTDDASYLWIGNTALSGYTTANALINNGGLHAATKVSGVINLTANTFYPIRIQYGQNASQYSCAISFSATGISETSNFSGYIFNGLGAYINYPTENALTLKSVSSINTDGSYYYNNDGSSNLVYFLMDNKWDGGGWMMLMKATRGTTFNYDANYWTTSNTLNTTDLTRNDADAKYATFNSVPIKDVMALWPDSGSGLTGGSISGADYWSWLINDYYTGRITALNGFSSANNRDAPTFYNPVNFPGFTSSIWSSQTPDRRHVMGGVSFLNAQFLKVRWGFIFNENGNFGSTDAAGGIGMGGGWGGSTTVNHSAGDFYGCCGSAGINRTMRVEVYGR